MDEEISLDKSLGSLSEAEEENIVRSPSTPELSVQDSAGMIAALETNPTNGRISLEVVLVAEFQRVASVASNARNETNTLFNLYLIGVGALAAGIAALQTHYVATNAASITFLEVIIFFAASILSFAFFARRFDLDSEYFESQSIRREINKIILDNLGPDREAANFVFKVKRIPTSRLGVMGLGTSIMNITIAILGSLSLAGCVAQARQYDAIVRHYSAQFMAEISIAGVKIDYFWEVLAGMIVLLLHLIYFVTIMSAGNENYGKGNSSTKDSGGPSANAANIQWIDPH